MAINQDYAGRTFEPSEPYEISRMKIREFADAIGDLSPLCRDEQTARAAGYPDVIAPPTFAIVLSMTDARRVTMDPGLGMNYAMVVHGEQRFEHARPLHAGDVVVSQTTVESIRQAGGLTMLTTATEVRTLQGDRVCLARSTLVERGTTNGSKGSEES